MELKLGGFGVAVMMLVSVLLIIGGATTALDNFSSSGDITLSEDSRATNQFQGYVGLGLLLLGIAIIIILVKLYTPKVTSD